MTASITRRAWEGGSFRMIPEPTFKLHQLRLSGAERLAVCTKPGQLGDL